MTENSVDNFMQLGILMDDDEQVVELVIGISSGKTSDYRGQGTFHCSEGSKGHKMTFLRYFIKQFVIMQKISCNHRMCSSEKSVLWAGNQK